MGRKKRRKNDAMSRTQDVFMGLTGAAVTGGIGAAVGGQAIAAGGPAAAAALPIMGGFQTASGFVPTLTTIQMGGIVLDEAKKLRGKKRSKYY